MRLDSQDQADPTSWILIAGLIGIMILLVVSPGFRRFFFNMLLISMASSGGRSYGGGFSGGGGFGGGGGFSGGGGSSGGGGGYSY